MSEIVEDTLEERTPTEEELDDFKNKMAEWLKMDEQINKLSIAMRERRKLQNALSGYIKDFMFKFNYHDVSINNAIIKARQRESLVPLKVNDINELDTNNIKLNELDISDNLNELKLDILPLNNSEQKLNDVEDES